MNPHSEKRGKYLGVHRQALRAPDRVSMNPHSEKRGKSGSQQRRHRRLEGRFNESTLRKAWKGSTQDKVESDTLEGVSMNPHSEKRGKHDDVPVHVQGPRGYNESTLRKAWKGHP